MSVNIITVNTPKQFKHFIKLPYQIHKNHDKWVPPLYHDEKKFFNDNENLAFKYCDTKMLLAYKDNKPAGRIVGIINKKDTKMMAEKTCRFGYFECYHDFSAAHHLFESLEEWAKANGMKKVIGPMGFTDLDDMGFVIDGFDIEPTKGTFYNHKYMIDLLNNLGFEKEIEMVAYRIDIDKVDLEIYTPIIKRLKKYHDIKLIEFQQIDKIKPYIKAICNFINKEYADLFGVTSLDEMEFKQLFDNYKSVIKPEFIKIATCNNEIVGFLFGLPHLNNGLIKAGGRLYPLGFIAVLHELKKTKQLDLMLGCVKKELRRKGIDVFCMNSLFQSAKKLDYKYADSNRELIGNKAVRSVMERYDGQVFKKFGLFSKLLS